MNKLFHVVWEFFNLGCTGFGGPLALVAQMQRKFVEERKWIEKEEFNQAFSMVKVMPGALAFQMAVFVGQSYAGFLGALAAAIFFILPSALLMIAFGIYGSGFEQNHFFKIFFHGLQIGAWYLILTAVRGLANPYREKLTFWFFVSCAAFLFHFGILPEPIIIVGAGLLMVLFSKKYNQTKLKLRCLPVISISILSMPVTMVTHGVLGILFWQCFYAGAFIFGSGVAIIPILQSVFVNDLKLMSANEFLYAVALGQITPGPLLITVTFIGYKLAGILGAAVATFAVFAPGFFHMTTWFPHFFRVMRKQDWLIHFSIGAIGAVVGCILISIFRLAESIDIGFKSLLCILMLMLIDHKFGKSAPLILLISGIFYSILNI